MIQLLLAMATGGRQMVTQTFSAGTTSFVAPATTTKIDTASGYGRRGNDAYYDSYSYYTLTYISYLYRRDGGTDVVIDEDPTERYGTAPAGYCNAVKQEGDPYPQGSGSTVYHSTQQCYEYETFSGSSYEPATRGTAATAFGKTFQGSLGDVQQTTTTFTDIVVTPGQTYSIYVPSGGTLTISYRK